MHTAAHVVLALGALSSLAGASGFEAVWTSRVHAEHGVDAVLPLPFDSRGWGDPFVPSHAASAQQGHTATAQHPHFQVQAPWASDLLAADAKIIELVREPTGWAFAHEAPVYDPETDTILFSSNAGAPAGRNGLGKNNALFKIRNVTGVAAEAERGQQLSFAEAVEEVPIDSPALQMINGGTPYGRDHVLLVSEGRGDVPGTLSLVHKDQTAAVPPRVLLNNAFGRQFASPNDASIHPVSGQIFFTDAWYGWVQDFRPEPSMPLMTWAFDPVTGSLRVLDDTVGVPNGVVVSPDGKRALVCDTKPVGVGVRPRKQAAIYAFDVATHTMPDGTYTHSLSGRRVLAWPHSGICDGVKMDTQARVYAGTADGVQVYDSLSGTPLLKLFVPTGAANMAFAGTGQTGRGGPKAAARMVILGEDRVYLATGLNVHPPDLTALPPQGRSVVVRAVAHGGPSASQSRLPSSLGSRLWARLLQALERPARPAARVEL